MVGRILAIIGGILVVALFAALIAPYFIDWTNFRRDFETTASRIIGKKVVVHGAVDARILPFPSVTMNDVRVGEDGEGGALVTADRFSMESELAPFLSGEALIYNMRIDNPKVKLRLNEDGALDWVRTGTPEIAASKVVLENVAITNGEVLFIDDQTGRNRHFTGLNLALSAKTLAGPWRVSGTGALDGQTGSFIVNTSLPENGQMPLRLRLLPDSPSVVAELEGQVGLSGLRPEYKGRFNLREKFRSEKAGDDPNSQRNAKSAAPRVAGTFEVNNDRLRIPSYEFKMGDPADPYIVTGEATIDAGRKPEFLLTAEGQQIDMSRFAGNAEGTAVEAIPLADRVRALMTLAADVPIPAMPGRANIKLPALVTGDTVIRDITLDMRPDGDGWQVESAEASLPGRTTLSAKGKLTLTGRQSFTGELLLGSNQPSGFAEWVTGSVPEAVRKLKTAGFSANVDLTPDLQRFENLEVVFGPSTLRGRLEHESGLEGPPSLSTELSGDAFDLDTMLALGGLLTGESASTSLLDHRIAAHIKVDQFAAFGLNAGNFDATFSLADGAIGDVRATVGDFYGAAVSLNGGIAELTDSPKGSAKLTVKAEDPTRLFQLMNERLPPHPVLKRLAENARYYAGADFAADLKLGMGDWPVEADLSGIAHGSRLEAKLAGQSLDLSNPQGLTIDATIENPDAWVMLGQAGMSTLQFDADQDGLLSLKINQPADSDPQLTLGYSSGTTTINVEGVGSLEAKNFLNGSYTVSVDSGDIAPYLMIAGISLPGMAEGLSLNGTASIYATPEAWSVEGLNGDADGNEFSGVLSRVRNRDKAPFSGELKVGVADFEWLAENIYGQVSGPLTGKLSNQHVPARASLPVDLDVALSADSFRLGALGTITGFNAHFRSALGKIELSDARGKLADGTFAGRAEIGNNEGNAYLRAGLEINGATLGTTFWTSGGKPAASGRSHLTLALDTTGTSAVKMLESATGSGRLGLTDMTVHGLDANALAPILAAADAMTGDISEGAVRTSIEKALLAGETKVRKLDLPFSIAGGKLRINNIAGETDRLTFQSEATIGLLEADLDASLTLAFKPGDELLAGADPSVTLTWQGELASPKRTVDITALTGFLSLRRFEQERRRVEILQASIAEKQRLRREAALYRAYDAERARLAQKAADESRLLKAAQEALKALAIEEGKRRAEERLQLQEIEPLPAQ